MPAARKPAAKKPAAADDTQPFAQAAHDAAAAVEAKPAPRATGRKAYVAVDLLSWRPHPLPRGTEVQDVLPADILQACLEDGRVTRENPLDPDN